MCCPSCLTPCAGLGASTPGLTALWSQHLQAHNVLSPADRITRGSVSHRGPATTSTTESVPPAEPDVGSMLNGLSREIGGATGIAVIVKPRHLALLKPRKPDRPTHRHRGEREGLLRHWVAARDQQTQRSSAPCLSCHSLPGASRSSQRSTRKSPSPVAHAVRSVRAVGRNRVDPPRKPNLRSNQRGISTTSSLSKGIRSRLEEFAQ